MKNGATDIPMYEFYEEPTPPIVTLGELADRLDIAENHDEMAFVRSWLDLSFSEMGNVWFEA